MVLFHYSVTFSVIVISVQGMSIKESFYDSILSVGLACVAAAIVLIRTKGMLGKNHTPGT
ncbi:hypothetical protein ES703_78577 [subsurface metagenome]